MENKIKYSPEALNDFDEIWDYISTQLLSPIAAESTVNGIIETVDTLKHFAKAGATLKFTNEIDSGYRFVKYKNYMAFYRINGNEVFVDRIIYGKSDYIKILFSD